MSNIAEMLVEMKLKTDHFQAGLKNAESGIQRFSKTGALMTTGITLPLVALGAAFAKAAAEEERSVKKMTAVFGSGAQDMEKSIQTLTKTIPVTDDALREMAVGVNVLVGSLGFGENKAAEMSKKVLALAGDLAAFNHVSMEEATDALEKALAGRTRGLVSLGVKIDEGVVKERAYSLGLLKHGETLAGVAKAEATWSLIMEKTTKQQGEAARTINDAVNAPARFKVAMTEMAEALGKVVLPTFAKLINSMTSLVEGITKLPGPMQTGLVAVAGLAAVIGPLVFVVANLTKGIGLLRVAIVTLTSANGLAGLGLLLSPTGLIIAGLIAAAYLVYKLGETAREQQKNVESFRDSIRGLSAEAIDANRKIIQLDIDKLSAERAKLAGPADKAIAAAVAARKAGRGVMQTGVSSETQAEIAELDRLLGLRRAQMTELNKPVDVVGAGGVTGGGNIITNQKTALEKLTDTANNALSIFNSLADVGSTSAVVNLTLTNSYDQVTASLRRLGDTVNPARKALLDLQKDLVANPAVLAHMVDIAPKLAITNVANLAPSLRLLPGSTPTAPIYQSKDKMANIYAGPEAKIGAAFTGSDFEKTVNEQASAMKKGKIAADALANGFAAANTMIGTAAAGLLSKIAGLGFGGQFGAAIGGGVGESLATKLLGGTVGKIFGGILGSSIPIVGGLIGGMAGAVVGKLAGGIVGKVGGFIGGLFGHHKKKVDDSAKSLENLKKATDAAASAMYNVPNIFKVALTAFGARVPEFGPTDGGAGPTTGGHPPMGPIANTYEITVMAVDRTMTQVFDEIEAEARRRQLRRYGTTSGAGLVTMPSGAF